MNDEIILKVTCRICGKEYQIKVFKEDFDSYINGDKKVQHAFPYLSLSDRELIISKTCENCWNTIFAEHD